MRLLELGSTFSLSPFSFQTPLSLLFFKLRFPFDPPFVLPNSALAVLALCCQYDLDGDFRQVMFQRFLILVLPEHSVSVCMHTVSDRQA